MWRNRARKRTAPKKTTTTEAGYGGQWAKVSRAYRARHPMCLHCVWVDPMTAHRADCVDHIIPHGGNRALLMDEANWQPLCHWHHTQKTWRERSGWAITWAQDPNTWVVSGKPGSGKRRFAIARPDLSCHVVGSLPLGHVAARLHKATWCVLAPLPVDWDTK